MRWKIVGKGAGPTCDGNVMDSISTAATAPGAGPSGGPAARRFHRLSDRAAVPPVTALTAPSGAARSSSDAARGVVPVEMAAGLRAWLVTDYPTLVALARDARLTTATDSWTGHGAGPLPEDSPLRSVFPPPGVPTVRTATGETHRRLREPLDAALATISQGDLARNARQVCAELVDGFAARGGADLVAEYVAPIPHRVLGAALGFDAATSRELFEASEGLDIHDVSFLLSGRAGDATPAGVLAQHPAYQGMGEAALGLAALVVEARDGIRAWLAQIVYALLVDERLAARSAGGRFDIDEVLDAALWTGSPVRSLAPRIAAEDFVLGDALVMSGDAVLLGVGAAVADSALRGDDVWSGAVNHAHLAFGLGPHACPASQTARLVVRTAVDVLRNRVPAPALAGGAEAISWTTDLRFVRPESLPVTFEPAVAVETEP